MSLITDNEQESTIRRMRLEMQGLSNSVESLRASISNTASTSAATATARRSLINNLTRNSDFNHSVDSWFNDVPTVANQLHEAANVYVFPPLAPVTVNDAAMTNGSNVLTCATSAPFTAAMNGRYVVVSGAGAAGVPLIGTFTYTSATTGTLSNPAATTVTGATVRINLQKLTHRNTKNNGTGANDALKDANHTDYAASISDPDWLKIAGYARLGSKNVAAFPFGHFASDGTTYVPLHQLYPGRVVFTRLNIARANKFVHVPGRLFLGIYNNKDTQLDWVRGSAFAVAARVEVIGGASFSTRTAQYQVIIDTQSGYSLVSQILDVANCPDEAALNSIRAKVHLTWTPFAGAINVKVYRKYAGENVFLLEESSSLNGTYTDINHPLRQNVGAAFPTVSAERQEVGSYWASALGELDDLVISGDAPWQPTEVYLPFPPSVNLAEVFDPHLIIGLTESLSTRLTGIETNGTTGVIEAEGSPFTAGMVGKVALIRSQSTNTNLTTTVASFTSSSQITLAAVPPSAASDNVLEIKDSQPRGLLFDCVGTAVMDEEFGGGEWQFHTDDNSEGRKQRAVAVPNGSVQGSAGGNPGTGGGTGGIVEPGGEPECVLNSLLIAVRGVSNTDIQLKLARHVTLEDRLWTGLGFEDENFNEVAWIKFSRVTEVLHFRSGKEEFIGTATHRFVPSLQHAKKGVAAASFLEGENTLLFRAGSVKLNAIASIEPLDGLFDVVSFGLKKTTKPYGHLFIANNWLSHNLKSLLLA